MLVPDTMSDSVTDLPLQTETVASRFKLALKDLNMSLEHVSFTKSL